MKPYICTVCGYTYDPENGDLDHNIPSGTAFKNLPDDCRCPVCSAEKNDFEEA